MTTPVNAISSETRVVNARTRKAKYKYMYQVLTILVFLGCTVFSVFQSTKSIIQFIDYPVTTTLSERRASMKDFPYILVCSYDLLKSNYSANYDANLFKKPDFIDSDEFENFEWRSLPSYYMPDKFENVLFSLLPNKQNAGILHRASPGEGKIVYNRAAGACLLFHPWKNSTRLRYLTLFVTNKNVKTIEVMFLHKPGIIRKLYVDDSDEEKFTEVYLAKKRHLHLEINEKVRLPVTDNACSKEEGYLQAKCQDKCTADYFMKELDVRCGLPWLKPELDVKMCDNYTEFHTLIHAMKHTTDYEDLKRKCNEECPEACKNVQYKVTMLPSDISTSDPFTVITIDPTVNVITEFAAYKFMNMFGDIGGIVGIFLGFSIFGIFSDLCDYIKQKMM